MTVLIIFVALALLGLLALAGAALCLPGQRRGAANDGIRAVDMAAFRNLVDPDEEEFLRSRLAASEFRSIQRERARATLDYVFCIAHNSKVLMQAAESARHSSDPVIAQRGQELAGDAIRLRIYCLRATAQLALAMVYPGLQTRTERLADGYELMSHESIALNCSQEAASHVAA